MPALMVFTKLPSAGRSKTRLAPPFNVEQATEVAEALLEDTFTLLRSCLGRARLVAAVETYGAALPAWPDLAVMPQRGADLGDRLANALNDAGPPALLLASDTPQMDPALLNAALNCLRDGTCESVVGPTDDGGFCCVGVRAWRPDLFDGVPMDSPRCCGLLLERWERLGLEPMVLPEVYRDVDRLEDAVAVARLLPSSRLATTVARHAAMLDGERLAALGGPADVLHG